MHLIENIIVEIIDPVTGDPCPSGEIGEVVVTVFNKTYPLIRVGTGDLSSMEFESCACGRTSPRLLKIVGRVGDAVKVRGMFVYKSQADEIISSFPEIGKYQLEVTREQNRDNLTIQIECVDDQVNEPALEERLKEKFRATCTVKLDIVKFVMQGSLRESEKTLVDRRTY